MAATVEVVIEAKDSFSGVLGDFGNIMTGIKSTVDLVIGAFETLAAPVIDFGQEAVLAAARVDTLAVVNGVLAENAGLVAAQIPPLVEAIRKQGIEAAVAQTVIASFIDAHLDLSKALDVARIAQDAAVISGMNSSETLDNIIYGITTLNPLVLRHAGIVVDLQLAYKEWADENDRKIASLTTEEKQMIALNAVIEAGTDIQGAYTAAMENAGKVITSFPRYFNDIMVAIGEPFQDAFGTVVFAIADFAKWLGKAVDDGGVLRPILDNIAVGAEKMADAFAFVLDIAQLLIGGLAGGGLAQLIYDIGAKIYMLPIPMMWELGDSIIAMSKAVADGQNPWYAFSDLLNNLAKGDGPLAQVSGFILEIQRVFQSEGLTATIGFILSQIPVDKIVAWLDELDAAIAKEIASHNWKASGDAFGDALMVILSGSIETKDSEAVPALGQAISDWFLGAMGVVDWEQAGQVAWGIFKQFLIDFWADLSSFWVGVWDMIDWRAIGIGFADMWSYVVTEGLKFLIGWDAWTQIGQAMMDGIVKPINEWDMKWDTWLNEHIIDPIKDFLGIASPSTVFMQIGKDIITGLVNGVGSLVDWATNAIKGIVATILEPFKFILDALGIDTSSLFSTTTGSVGGGSMGSTTTSGTGTTTGSGTGTTVNQYFAGATINVGSWDEIAYDCIYPNPFILATSGQLGSGGSGGGK